MIIIDISKAFATLNHNLLVAKPRVYGLVSSTALWIKRYYTNRYQHCKIWDPFSEWKRIIAGVPQGSNLRPLFLNIFTNDIFLYIYFTENSVLCNYVNDSTHYVSGQSLHIIIKNFKANFLMIFKLFHENVMVLNPDKYRFMVLDNPNYTYNHTCNGKRRKCW